MSYKKKSFVWCGMAIRKVGLMDPMSFTERFAYCRKNKPYKFNVYYRKNKSKKLSRPNTYCNYRVKSSSRAALI